MGVLSKTGTYQQESCVPTQQGQFHGDTNEWQIASFFNDGGAVGRMCEYARRSM